MTASALDPHTTAFLTRVRDLTVADGHALHTAIRAGQARVGLGALTAAFVRARDVCDNTELVLDTWHSAPVVIEEEDALIALSDATVALQARATLITTQEGQDAYDILTAPARTVLGSIHPDDPELPDPLPGATTATCATVEDASRLLRSYIGQKVNLRFEPLEDVPDAWYATATVDGHPLSVGAGFVVQPLTGQVREVPASMPPFHDLTPLLR